MRHIALIAIAIISTITAQAQLSVETLGVIKHQGITKGEDYGASVGVGWKLNQYVTGKVRAVSYSNDDWRGGVVDEGSALVEASLLKSANGKLALKAIGGADRDFTTDDWGFSVGIRPEFQLTKSLSIVAESRIRAWFKQTKDLISSVGLQYTF